MPLSREKKRELALVVALGLAAGAAAVYKPLFVNKPFTLEQRQKIIQAVSRNDFQERTGFILRDTVDQRLALEYSGVGNLPHAQPHDSLKTEHVDSLRAYLHEHAGVWIEPPKPGTIAYEDRQGRPDTMKVGERRIPVLRPTNVFKGVELKKSEAPGRRILRENLPKLTRSMGISGFGGATPIRYRPKR